VVRVIPTKLAWVFCINTGPFIRPQPCPPEEESHVVAGRVLRIPAYGSASITSKDPETICYSLLSFQDLCPPSKLYS
jgi:hypothetical protein